MGMYVRIIDDWRANHIMSRNRELFEYEFVRGGKVCVMIAKNRSTGYIEGMLGYNAAGYGRADYLP